MASLSFRKFVAFRKIFAGRRFVLRLAAYGLGGAFALAAPAAADAACVAAALNKNGKQIKGTRSITHGVFPKIVCYRAVRHCERRLNELRHETGRARRYARCEVIASGPRAAEIFGPPLEGWRVRPDERGPDPRYDDYAYRGEGPSPEDYRDEYQPPHDLGEPGAHDGWRSAERDDRYQDPRYDEPRYDDRRYDDEPPYNEPRDDDRGADERAYDDRAYDDRDYQGGDPLIDDLLRDERQGSAPPDDRYAGEDRYTPYEGDREARSCNIDACAARYKTFRASDCTYKPTLYERRLCPL